MTKIEKKNSMDSEKELQIPLASIMDKKNKKYSN